MLKLVSWASNLSAENNIGPCASTFYERREKLTQRVRGLRGRVIGIAEYDPFAVRSRWLETGPLVALEAFAADIAVLGANLGGMEKFEVKICPRQLL